jgi:hypothetical protein
MRMEKSGPTAADFLNDADEAEIARIGALGHPEVDSRVASQHLTAMAAAGRRPASRFGRAKVVAAFAAGLVLGGTSLASAGVMGSTVQDTVADVAAKVNVNLPGGGHGPERYGTGQAGCPGYTTRMNHGQYVKSKTDPAARAAAAASDCGKPVQTVGKSQKPENENESEADTCKPAWAGPGLTKEQRKAAKDAATSQTAGSTCAVDDQGENESDANAQDNQGNQGDQGKPENTPPSTAAVTPPTGGQDDNAGLPTGGSVPGENEQGDQHRDEAPATTLPSQADGQGDQGGASGQQP